MSKNSFSSAFVLMAVLFTVCLISSNLFAAKVFAIGKVALPCAVLIFPISYILNDCFTEVWGYRKARLVIWMAFAMNLFVALVAQLAVILPSQEKKSFDFSKIQILALPLHSPKRKQTGNASLSL